MASRDIKVSAKMQEILDLPKRVSYETALPLMHRYKHSMVASSDADIAAHNERLELIKQNKRAIKNKA